MATLLRQGVRRIGGSLLHRTQAAVTSPAVADERRRLLVTRRMLYTDKRTQAAVTSPAVAQERHRLVPRRMLFTEKRGRWRRYQDLQEQFRHAKLHQICWELIKSFPARKIFNFVAGTTVLFFMLVHVIAKITIMAAVISAAVIVVGAGRELKREEAEENRQLAEENRQLAEKRREQ